MKTFKQIGTEIGELVERKAVLYGDSMEAVQRMMLVLYPDGISVAQMPRALALVHKLDKIKRYATDNDHDGESPLIDDAGYSIRCIQRDQAQKESAPCTSGNANESAAKESSPAQPASAAQSTKPSTSATKSETSDGSSTSGCNARLRGFSGDAATSSSPVTNAKSASPQNDVVDRWLSLNACNRCAACTEQLSKHPSKRTVDIKGLLIVLHDCCSLGDISQEVAL